MGLFKKRPEGTAHITIHVVGVSRKARYHNEMEKDIPEDVLVSTLDQIQKAVKGALENR